MAIISTIDSRLLRCPIALITIKRESEKLAPGQAVEVVGDSPSLLRDLTAFARNHSRMDLDMERDIEGERFRVFITKL